MHFNRAWLPALLVAFGFQGAWARELIDSTGVSVQLSDKPLRIVTLAPSLGELAADLAGEELHRIVGVSEYTDYPPALLKVRSVGNYARFNLEAVLSLKPDLILATHDGNSKDQIDHLRELRLPVVVVTTESLDEVEKSVRLVAKAMGAEKEGERMAQQLHTGFVHIRERVSPLPKARVLLQVGGEPLISVGKRSFLHEALEAVGGINVYADSKANYPRPALEDAVSRNPEVIVVLVLGTDPKPFVRMAGAWKQFPALAAVKNKRVKILKADQLLRPTLRLLEGLQLLEKAIHGQT